MTLRRAAMLCLLSGLGLMALGLLAWGGDYLFGLGIAGFLAVMAGSQLLTASIQMPKPPAPGDAGDAS